MESSKSLSRRKFLHFLSGSPLLASPWASGLWASPTHDPSLQYLLSREREVISSLDQALNVFDLEAVAREKLPPAHYGFLATGVTDEATQVANRKGFDKIQLRMRRLVDVQNTHTSTELFGVKWPSPLGLAPVGAQMTFHPEGEIAVARAAHNRNTLQVLSTFSTSPLKEVNLARGEPVWYQLYVPGTDWQATTKMIKRAEAAGCEVLVITVDIAGVEMRETSERFKREDSRDCTSCHGPTGRGLVNPRPLWDGTDVKREEIGAGAEQLDWQMIDRIRDSTRMRIVLKGILTAEDARLCVQHGMDGVLVSNHGGRVESSGRGTIECLPEVVAAVNGKIPVMLDGGVRRGADIFKALSLGAKMVFVGRPYLWGLAAFGTAGVEQTVDILNRELLLVMKQAGTTSVDKISSSSIVRR